MGQTRRVEGAAGSRRRGMAMGFLLVTMLFVVSAFIAVGVDLGRVQSAKNQLQVAVDAAARAGAASLGSGTTAAQNAAIQIAGYNSSDAGSVTLSPSEISFGNWNPSRNGAQKWGPGTSKGPINAVQINVARQVPLTWGKLLGSSTCTIHARVTATSTGVSGQASLIGVNGITVSGNAYTDSYDATKGAYNAATAKKNGSIASNGNISLQNYAKVNGDVRCGMGKTTTVAGTATVTGLNAPMTSSTSYPSVTLPASYTTLGDVNMSSGTTYLPGGTYVIDNLVMSGTSHVVWQGPTTLYIRYSYNISGSAAIDTYQNLPANRKLYFLPTCTTATWTGTNDCVGELYAPDTDFSISGSVDLYGRVTAKTINLSSGGGMHYDESLTPPGQTQQRETVSVVQ